MNINHFDTHVQEESPRTPEHRRELNTPPMLRRGGQDNPRLDTLQHLLKKYLHAQIEIKNLENELMNCRTKSEERLSVIDVQNGIINSHKVKLTRIQEILFENSESIPNGVYIRLMDSLVSRE